MRERACMAILAVLLSCLCATPALSVQGQQQQQQLDQQQAQQEVAGGKLSRSSNAGDAGLGDPQRLYEREQRAAHEALASLSQADIDAAIAELSQIELRELSRLGESVQGWQGYEAAKVSLSPTAAAERGSSGGSISSGGSGSGGRPGGAAGSSSSSSGVSSSGWLGGWLGWVSRQLLWWRWGPWRWLPKQQQRQAPTEPAQAQTQARGWWQWQWWPWGGASGDAGAPWRRWNASAGALPLLDRPIAWTLHQNEQQQRPQQEEEEEEEGDDKGDKGRGGDDSGRRRKYGTLSFDEERAATLAAYTSVVYCNESQIQKWDCGRCKKAGPMTVYKTVFDVAWDLVAYAGYSSKLGAKLIVFRGTDSHSLYNWVQNMHYWRTDFSIPFPNATGALVHTGFVSSYNASSLRANITEAMHSLQRWHPWAPLYVVGHSLGGALATLCALDLKFFFNLRDVRVYTFGSPRVGNTEFVDYFDWQVQESYRLTHNRDIVPSVPLQIMGFRHVPREAWQVDFAGHEAITVCSDSGEDPACHDSMCYLGLCTSIADHLVYMGAHMYRAHTDAC